MRQRLASYTAAMTGYAKARRGCRWLVCAATGVMLTIVLPANAAVYRCEVGGRVVFTDQPCAPAAPSADLPPLNTVNADTVDHEAARRYDQRETAKAHAYARANDAWLEDYEARQERRKAVRKALVEGRVVRGMTPAEVQHAWGLPTRRNDSDHARQRWVYVNGRARQIVEFADGVVVRVRFSEARRRR